MTHLCILVAAFGVCLPSEASEWKVYQIPKKNPRHTRKRNDGLAYARIFKEHEKSIQRLFERPLTRRITAMVDDAENYKPNGNFDGVVDHVMDILSDFITFLEVPPRSLCMNALLASTGGASTGSAGGIGDLTTNGDMDALMSRRAAACGSILRRLRGECLLGGMDADLSQHSRQIASRIMGEEGSGPRPLSKSFVCMHIGLCAHRAWLSRGNLFALALC
jgi:hypothetical protein